MKDLLCVIPARKGSKGIPGKNLIEFGGKPLLAWTIESALESKTSSRVIVSTDCLEICEIAKSFGAEVPYLRPKSIANDNVHAVHVALHALEWLEHIEKFTPAAVMMLLPTSPLRLSKDIIGAVNLFEENNADSVISIVNLGKYLTNLRYLNGLSVERLAPNEEPNAQRQGLKPIYGVNGSIFIAKSKVLIEEGTFHTDVSLGYVMDLLNSTDINSPKDLEVAREFCLNHEPWRSFKR